MSLRIGFYDFFAYTIPGVFYVLVIVYGLSIFGFIGLDLRYLNNLSLFTTLLFVGTGYVAGILLDPVAYYMWYKPCNERFSTTIESAFKSFEKEHQWLELSFEWLDWSILLQAVKSKSIEMAEDIEEHNAASIMLRNLSFGLLLASILCLVVHYSIGHSWWNVPLFLVFSALSIIAIWRSGVRRRWFVRDILDAYVACYLLKTDGAGVKLSDVARGQVVEGQQVAAANAAADTSKDSTDAGTAPVEA